MKRLLIPEFDGVLPSYRWRR